MNDWTDTKIWHQLEALTDGEATAAKALLTRRMPDIQAILSQAQTSPSDFTLHDTEHSFRVAEWMAEVIPGEVVSRLCPYELALLLLSAYLHDIGMTPQQGRVERHWGHLVYGPPKDTQREPLSPQEVADLQGWLDDERPGLTPPLAVDGPTEDVKRLADQLMTHYCRFRHNDWSAEWIRANLAGEKLPGYETWVADLIQLCRSHHEGYDELRQDRFNPRPAGSKGSLIHHRYLACVLRIADVLDIDPGRTPDVIFRHRAVRPGSVLFWRKDHTTWIRRDGSRLVLTAYPESAVVENAIRKTADGILHEIQTCARLSREMPFTYWALRTSEPLPHIWDFPETLTVHVQPQGDAYVYIEGAFRPNTEKLLELLSGTQLYGNPLAAVRELLQNAFDAVKEEIARQRLRRPDGGRSEIGESLAQLQRVELRLEENDGRYSLVCTDTGVGMSRAVIENYLLVSGSSQRRDILELERRCKEAGFRLGRTGQFGIGVLSYFMLADHVEIRTRRSQSCGDSELTGWSFATDGVGSFGELKKDTVAAAGSEIRLQLRSEVVKDPALFAQDLRKFLLDTLVHLPCTFQLTSSFGSADLSFAPGWLPLDVRVDQFFVGLTNYQEPKPGYPLHSAQRDLIAKHRGEWELIRSEFYAKVRWHLATGELPHELGTYRIAVPYFDLPGGICGCFLRILNEEGKLYILPVQEDKLGIFPHFPLSTSLQGMNIDIIDAMNNLPESTIGFHLNCLKEINFEMREAGKPHVSRNGLMLSDHAISVLTWLKQREAELLSEALCQKDSEFNDLNRVICYDLPSSSFGAKWARRDDYRGFYSWNQIELPTASGLPDFEYLWQQKSVTTPRILMLLHQGSGYIEFEWALNLRSERVALWRGKGNSRFQLVKLWAEPFSQEGPCNPMGPTAFFPPSWTALVGGQLSWHRERPLYNVNNNLLRYATSAEEDWYSNLGDTIDPLSLREDLLASKGKSAIFLTNLLKNFDDGRWLSLCERDPEFGKELWNQVPDLPAFLCFWDYNRGLFVLRPEGCDTLTNPQDIFEVLPHPGEEWVIYTAPAQAIADDTGPAELPEHGEVPL
jgi:hypothetical protein